MHNSLLGSERSPVARAATPTDAAQFMPFAALTGYNQVIEQTAKHAETAIAQAEAQGDTDFGA